MPDDVVRLRFSMIVSSLYAVLKILPLFTDGVPFRLVGYEHFIILTLEEKTVIGP